MLRDPKEVLASSYFFLYAMLLLLSHVSVHDWVAPTEPEIDRVLQRGSFESMKAHPSQFAPPKMPFVKDEEGPLMIRRDVSGRSDEKLMLAQQVTVDRIRRNALRRLGSDLPYEAAFDGADGAEETV